MLSRYIKRLSAAAIGLAIMTLAGCGAEPNPPTGTTSTSAAETTASPDKNNLTELRSFFLGIIEELKSE